MTAESPGQAEQGSSGFATKLAFDLGLTRQREEDAPSALAHVGITPVGGWTRSSECTPEVFSEVLVAARFHRSSGRGPVTQVAVSLRSGRARARLDRDRSDLVATVAQPLKDLYGERFEVAPYPVLFKPSHGLRILRNEGAGFSPKAAYIFRKQLEEADAIVGRARPIGQPCIGGHDQGIETDPLELRLCFGRRCRLGPGRRGSGNRS
jgi:hypothetical protein